MIFTRSERADDIRLKNTTGAEIAQDQMVIIGGQAVIANELTAINAIGSFALLGLGVTLEVATADLTAAEDTFGTVNQAVYFVSATGKFSDTLTQGYYLVGILQSVKADGSIVFVTVPTNLMGLADSNGDFAMGVGTLTVAAAATPVHVIPEAQVPAGKKFYLLGFLLSVGGATAWTDATATIVKLQDTNGTPVVAATIAKAQLTGNAQLGMLSSGVTLGTEVRAGSGLTAAKGLDIVADAVFAAGSTISITAFGVIK